MAEPFLSELRAFGFNFAPRGWAMCNGQLLPINQNQALYSLLGTAYGGNGTTTFALPDLRGRVPIHSGGGFTRGQQGGEPSHTLTTGEMPAHTHVLGASTLDASASQPASARLAVAANVYGAPTQSTTLAAESVANAGANQPHTNLQPYLALNWCIALVGLFPSPN